MCKSRKKLAAPKKPNPVARELLINPAFRASVDPGPKRYSRTNFKQKLKKSVDCNSPF